MMGPGAIQAVLGFWGGRDGGDHSGPGRPQLDGVALSVDYLFEMPTLAKSEYFNLDWCFGLGGGVGVSTSGGPPGVAVAGIAGLEFNFTKVPFDLAVEYRPSVGLLPGVHRAHRVHRAPSHLVLNAGRRRNAARSIAAATDARARARLRVELAELVRARDPAAARDELTSAAREAGADAGADAGGDRDGAHAAAARARGVAGRVRADRRGRWRSPASWWRWRVLSWTPISRATRRVTLLALVRDERLPLHHRRAAASKVVAHLRPDRSILGRAALLHGGDARRREGAARAAAAALALPAHRRDPARVAARRRDARAASCSSGRSAAARSSWPPSRWPACARTSTRRPR